MAQSLAVKYRPTTWEAVTEQSSVITILQNQLRANEVKHAYLFCGGAGTGKTTCARIFANEINHGAGNPIEMDAASNNSVDDIRTIADQAKLKSLDSDYKIYIIDECHALSNSAWQAMLKLIEEPPVATIFIFCTTDPQKIPKTILSRVQRYDFQRISEDGIFTRLHRILYEEDIYASSDELNDTLPALEYIAKLADGGMRDAITMLDKCLSYSTELTVANVVKALGVANYETMQKLTDAVIGFKADDAVKIITDVHTSGIDLKQFVRQYLQFMVDVNVWLLTGKIALTTLPATDELQRWLISVDSKDDFGLCSGLLDMIMTLNSEIKWETNPKMIVLARFMSYIEEVRTT